MCPNVSEHVSSESHFEASNYLDSTQNYIKSDTIIGKYWTIYSLNKKKVRKQNYYLVFNKFNLLY